MTLRFEVASANSQGINARSTNHVDVDPSTLSQEEIKLIEDRLDGIDVMEKGVDLEITQGSGREEDTVVYQIKGLKKSKNRVVSKSPTFSSLMEAVREDEAKAKKRLDDFRLKFRSDAAKTL